MKLGDLPLMVIFYDLDALSLDVLRERVRKAGYELRDCLNVSLLWNCRGLWGFIPQAILGNTVQTHIDYLKLKDLHRDRQPKIVLRLQDTMPVPASLAKIISRCLEQRKQLRQADAPTDPTAESKAG